MRIKDMIRAFNAAATGMQAQSTQVDNTANNLANINTTAFKRNSLAFQDLVYQTLRPPGIEVLQARHTLGADKHRVYSGISKEGRAGHVCR